MAGIANLFTREFFEMCRDRLTDEGVMCQWIHTYNLTFADFMMVVRTFMDVMDHGMIWQTNLGDFLLIGSKTPIVVDFERLRRDVEADSRISRHLAKAHLNDIRALMGDFMARKEHLVEMEAYRAAETNIDDSCRLEFTAPIAYYNYLKQVQPAQIAELRSDPSDLFDPATLPKEMAELFALVPQARRLEASGLDLARQGNPAALAARMYEAYTMYPYDISLAFLAVDACRGMVEFNRATLTAQKALQWLVQACKIYETVGHAPDPMMMAGIMYQGRKIALHINDKESAAYFEGLMERLGGPDLLSKMQEIDNTLSAAHESDEAA